MISNRAQFACLIAFICLLSGTILFAKASTTKFHGDESGWISAGLYYSTLLLKRDFSWEKWECAECGGFGSVNPQVGKWLVGLPLRLTPFQSPLKDTAFIAYYDWDVSFQENVDRGNVPPDEILLAARSASVAFGVVCCLLVFAVAYLAGNAWIGIIAVALLLVNSLFVETVTRAMTDVHYNVFLLCLGLAAMSIAKARTRQSKLLTSSVCGILAGLACSVKVTGAVVGGLLFVAIITYAYVASATEKKVFAISLAIFVASSLSIVYALNPYLWPSINRIHAASLTHEVRSLSEELVNGTVRRESVRERYPQLSNLSRVAEFPRLFLRWKERLEGAKAMPSASWNGSRLGSLHERLLIEYASFPMEFVFLIIGTISCYARARISLSARKIDFAAISLMYFLVNYVFILIFMDLNWDRYYLPTIIASKTLVAMGIYDVAGRVHGVSWPIGVSR